MSRWCPPAAATSSASRASAWPTTSAQVGRGRRLGVRRRPPARRRPRRLAARPVAAVARHQRGQRARRRAPSKPGHQRASAALAAGTTTGARRRRAPRPARPAARRGPAGPGRPARARRAAPAASTRLGRHEPRPPPAPRRRWPGRSRAGLGQAGRRQVDRDPPVGGQSCRCWPRRPDPVARLVQRRVGQPDQIMNDGSPWPEVGLDLDQVRPRPRPARPPGSRPRPQSPPRARARPAPARPAGRSTPTRSIRTSAGAPARARRSTPPPAAAAAPPCAGSPPRAGARSRPRPGLDLAHHEQSPSRATMSISPWAQRQLRSSTVSPASTRCARPAARRTRPPRWPPCAASHRTGPDAHPDRLRDPSSSGTGGHGTTDRHAVDGGTGRGPPVGNSFRGQGWPRR